MSVPTEEGTSRGPESPFSSREGGARSRLFNFVLFLVCVVCVYVRVLRRPFCPKKKIYSFNGTGVRF